MENIKSCIKKYFIKLNGVHSVQRKSLKVPYNPAIASEMYVGSEDEHGYISWQLLERKELIKKKSLSEEVGINIHESLIEFFNAYYFFEISGVYKSYDIDFDYIVPNTILKNFVSRRYMSLESGEGEIQLIQVGILTEDSNDNLILCLVNNTGQIACYDYDKGVIEIIANSLVELICNMEPRC